MKKFKFADIVTLKLDAIGDVATLAGNSYLYRCEKTVNGEIFIRRLDKRGNDVGWRTYSLDFKKIIPILNNNMIIETHAYKGSPELLFSFLIKGRGLQVYLRREDLFVKFSEKALIDNTIWDALQYLYTTEK